MLDASPRRHVFGGFAIWGQKERRGRTRGGVGDTRSAHDPGARERRAEALRACSGRDCALLVCPVGRELPRLVDRIGRNRWTLTWRLTVLVDRSPDPTRASPSFSMGRRACPAQGVGTAASRGRLGSKALRMENHGERGRKLWRRARDAAPLVLLTTRVHDRWVVRHHTATLQGGPAGPRVPADVLTGSCARKAVVAA